ncbi:RIO-like kinase [Desulfurococcaceae archaeon AG1]|jgi:RIO kinase 1|nr:MAG: serine protein kinase RIO [Desulfurococcaceae archaeon]GAY25333.1 RIO-like kinase [Desulfurococcaceae archaeon AG1]
MSVIELSSRGCLKSLKGVVSSGKEARVYWGKGKDNRDLAVKIYLTLTSEFRRSMIKYLAGDPRFDEYRGLSPKKLIYIWARKEFSNLNRMFSAGIRVPEPLCLEKNVLVMEFIGYDGKRAPLLKEAYEMGELSIDDLEKIYWWVIEAIRKMVKDAGLVHGDLSEYNIMIFEESPVIIDVSQAVSIDHPNSREFLKQDIYNITRFFSKAGVDVEEPSTILSDLLEIN